jgi:hypothetical protein
VGRVPYLVNKCGARSQKKIRGASDLPGINLSIYWEHGSIYNKSKADRYSKEMEVSMDGTLVIFTLWMLRLVIPFALLITLGTMINRNRIYRY